MPFHCRYLRTRLQIEYLRLLDFSEVAGLIDYKDGQDFPKSLKADRLVLVAILTEIRALMEDFAHINGKYVQLRPDDDSASRQDANDWDLREEFSSISLSYEKKAAARKYPRGMNHIARGSAMARDVVKNPKRLLWVAIDEDVFIGLLGRLTELNDYLHELMHGHQARVLEQTNQRTYLEMVQVRTSVEELTQLVTAAMLLDRNGPDKSSSGVTRRRNDIALASLAGFKLLNAASDNAGGEQPPSYDAILNSTQKNYSQVSHDEQSAATATRTEGKFYAGDHTVHHVWIEWKPYQQVWDKTLMKQVPSKDYVKRVKALVALLQSSKPPEFCAPQCLGYFDDRDDSENSQHEFRFGLIFQKPDGVTSNVAPVTLHHLLGTIPKPSLTHRVALAHRVAVGVLYLHAVNWLHKALRSDNVLFFPTANVAELTNPYLSGFSYARPDRPEETTTGGDLDSWTELYVHPDYQGFGTKCTYRKTFDIYSLGIILLEIAHWSKIEQVVDINPGSAPFADLKRIRSQLLQPESESLATVRANCGDRYYEAVKSCIEGGATLGIDEGGNEVGAEMGAKLQQGFTSQVVDALESVKY
jgi:serine/threonine protein kinase